MKTLVFFLFFALHIHGLQAQSIGIAKSALGSGEIQKNAISIASIVGQSSPITQIGKNQIQLLQGFQFAMYQGNWRETISALTVYPNPSSGKFNLSLPHSSAPGRTLRIDLIDTFGRILKTLDVQSAPSILCDFSDLSNGIYHLQLNEGNIHKGYAKIFIK